MDTSLDTRLPLHVRGRIIIAAAIIPWLALVTWWLS